jgi:2-methylcitrate dehydratase PrpD
MALVAGRRILLDTIACAVGGWDLPSSSIIREVVGAQGGRAEATVIGDGLRLPAPLAAYINAHLSNAIDADDTLNYTAHIGAATVAPALAAAQRENSSGLETLAALIVAYEVAGRVGMSMQRKIVDAEGVFRFTPVTGHGWLALPAATAAGRLLKLDTVQMTNAFGLAAAASPLSTSGKFGLEFPRPTTKYGLYGEMAQGGVMAALLAQRGYTSHPNVLDGDAGLWRMVGSPDCKWEALTTELGQRWLVDEGL